MEQLNDYLRNLSVESLMELSSMSEALTFDENSIIRRLIVDYKISHPHFHLGVIGLRHQILMEITRRYYGNLIPNQ